MIWRRLRPPLLTAFSLGFLLTQICQAEPPPAAASDRAFERYKQLLLANPTEGTALDRLWKLAEERNATGALIEEFREPATRRPQPALLLGHLLKRAGRPDEAEAAYRRAAELDPASPLPPLALAALATARGEPARAAGFLEAALPRLPTGDPRRAAETLLALGAARQAAGDPARAAGAWERTVALDPRDPSLRERLANAYEATGQFERAAGHLEWLEKNAASPEARAGAARALGRLGAARGDFDAARAAFERGLALTAPGNWLRAEFQRSLIALHARAGRLPELEARWRADAERTPRDLGGWLQLAELYRQTAEPAKERETLERITALAPRSREPALRLAQLLADAENADPARAAGILDALLKAQPGNVDLVFARAELDLRLNRPAAAAARVEAARAAARPDDETLATAALGFFTRHRLADPAERLLRAEAARQPAAEEPALALAAFLFSQKNADAARAALDASIARVPANDPAARAARLARAAELCKTQRALPDALRYAREAVRAEPNAAARRLTLGDLLSAQNEPGAAREEFEAAVALAGNDAEREAAEHKLFDVLQTAAAPPTPEEPVPPRLTGARPVRGVAPSDGPVNDYARRLQAAVDARPTAENFLRLARWQSWRRALPDALEAARHAADAAPDSVPARELAARLAADSGDRALAAETLETLAALDRDPAARARHRRALGQLKLDDGDTDGALAIFTALEKANPGSREALADLALAQQRADRWSDALGTWERLHTLPGLTPAARDETRRPLLFALERLGQHGRALEILLAALDASPDAAARQALFRDALALAEKHGLLEAFAARAEARAAARPAEEAPLAELAAVRRAQGREAEADELLERAALAAPDPAVAAAPGGALVTLVEAAERRGDLDAAVRRQRRVALLAGSNADVFAKLAELQAAAGELDAAAQTWSGAASRFARDPAALTRAADFFESPSGDDVPRARELLARAVALDPADLPRQLRVGRLAADAGDAPAARAAFEAVLAGTPAEGPADALELPPELAPGPITGAPPGLPAAGVLKEERRLRLAAIRGLGRLLAAGGADPAARGRWLERWRGNPAPGETLWAFFHAGANDLALDHLAGLMKNGRRDVDALNRAYVGLALNAGDAPRLARWLRESGEPDATGARRDLALDALRRFLPTVAGEDRLDPVLVGALFPARGVSRETLWQGAGIFAQVQRYDEAAALGERVLALTPAGRAAVALPLARWQLFGRRAEQARETLRAALDDPTFSTGTNSSLFADEEAVPGEVSDNALESLRLLHALLPAPERAGFREAFLARLGAQVRAGGRSPVQAALAQALLGGLAGDGPAARAALERLVALRPVADGRPGGLAGETVDPAAIDAGRWNFLLAAGARLRGWHLDGLALALWRRALPDSGMGGLQGSANREGPLRELRNRLAALELAAADDPARIGGILDAFLRVNPSPAAAVGLAPLLIENGAPGAAGQLAEMLTRRGMPPVLGAEVWRLRLRALARAGDLNGRENLLRSLLRDGAAPPAGLARRELVVALADQLEAAGDLSAARRVLENAVADTGGRDGFLLARLAACRERLGQPEEAARLLREALRQEPGNADARLGLSACEDRLGRPEAARAALEEAPGMRAGTGGGASAAATLLPAPPLALALARRDLAAGEPNSGRAAELAQRFLRAGQGQAAVEIVGLFAEPAASAEIRAAGRRLLAATVHGSRDAQTRFNAQQALLEKFCSPDGDAAGFSRELHRLGRLAEASPKLRPAFANVRDRLLAERPDRAGELEADLRREWRDGRADGDAAAGSRLLKLLLRGGPAREAEVRGVAGAFRKRRLDEGVFLEAATALEQADRPDLAAALAERLARRFPSNEAYALLLARTWWKAGARDEAERLLGDWENVGAVQEESVGRVAALWRELAEPTRARGVLRRALERNPDGWQGGLRAQLAGIEIASGTADLAGVRRLLRAAYADPGCRDLDPLLTYLDARGQLAEPGAFAGFNLSADLRPKLAAAAFARLEASGRGEAARRLVEARPAILRETPAVAARLREHAAAARDLALTGALAAIFEKALAQSELPAPRLAHELARLLDDWADASSDDPAAGERLRRACQLEPADFERTRRLADFLNARGQPGEAAAALRGFLAPGNAGTAPSDREEARRRLAEPEPGQATRR